MSKTVVAADSSEKKRLTRSPDAQFLLLPLPGFGMLPFGGFVDKLRFSADEADYSQQRYCKWQVLGLRPGLISSSSGIGVKVDVTEEEVVLSNYDYLVLFGSRTARKNIECANEYRGLLRKAVSQGLKLVSIDNASFLLAACGLLAGHKVTIHWRHEQEFRTAFPHIELCNELLYCFDRGRITCSGGSAAIDLAVELLALHCGRTRALKGLADMLVDDARGAFHHLRSLDIEGGNERHVSRAISLMRIHMGGKKTIDEIAVSVSLSRRQLDRLFQRQFGRTAHGHWTEMRLQHVRWRLVNSDLSLGKLADEIGIQDTSYLCKLFRKRFGESPNSLRREGA